MDNDVYGHVNNVQYYSFFDTAIATYLIEAGGLDMHRSPVIGLCAESQCWFRASFCFPEPVEAGVRVAHLGRRAVRYEIGLFAAGRDEASAQGYFVHVFVDRETRQAVPIPERIHTALARLKTPDPGSPRSGS
ncbi:MAG: thioesterase family protein [Ectothiorhodospiraceae bacterium]|nr:thioesterase family protein [Planctomycetota bacterium]MCP5152410.1 thioesterase family protein [Chromatiales bacterium]MCP5154258.1 thioesterase family protein [Ectothiorhodospiraceae bacterium]